MIPEKKATACLTEEGEGSFHLVEEREYRDDDEHSYRLVYKPVYPRMIEAHTGEPVSSSW
ncbi:hypothetical protein UM89_21975 [Bacillus subtilis]|nr:hypothetical protein UM89_21975 [Bacillus subtilis]